MNNLTKNLMCIQLRTGVEIWAEKERVKILQGILLQLKNHIFINYDDQIINTADITGIFTAQIMDECVRRKNKQWKCEFGTWHNKEDYCECGRIQEQKRQKEEIDKIIEEADKDIDFKKRNKKLQQLKEIKKQIIEKSKF